ncbi:MAG: YqgE/AlgH family protein [Desulfobacterales bacterium]|jgi:putative transcriptional regulator|nr:YqgE/AlgH family protein [Desulfobacterales bacterium]
MHAAAPESLKGHFLMAMPGLTDPNFSLTVTCLCEHSAQGAMGIVINRRHELLSGKDLFEELDIACGPNAGQIPVHIGGPVHAGEIFILHGQPFGWEGSLMVTPTLALSNTRDILEALALGRGPTSFLISLGCAGWGPGQLEMEIRDNAWLTHPVFDEAIFALPLAARWEEAVRRIGVSPAMLSGTAGNA